MTKICPFCHITPGDIVSENALVLMIEDRFPVSPGHTLIIPRRHVETYFDADSEEKAALWAMVETARDRLDSLHAPAGYNIGINVGETAGQTIMHLHIHVIPRYPGDMADPRGGVRHVIPDKGKYQP